jgi:hypothetical protein
MMNGSAGSLATSATTGLAKVDPERSLTDSTTNWPAWAEAAVGYGEANHYFDPEAACRFLSKAQRDGLPSLIATAERKMQGPMTADAAQLARKLELIAVRIQPTISDNAATAWAASLVASLSKIPADILSHAVAAAQYQQFEFANQVGPFIAAEAAEPVRLRRTKINRLREMQLKAGSLAAPGADVCPPDEADKIIDEFKLRPKATKPAERPEIDWDVERVKRLADTNFLRALHGKPAFTMAEWQDDMALRNRKRSDLADDLSDSISDVAI